MATGRFFLASVAYQYRILGRPKTLQLHQPKLNIDVGSEKIILG
jgi:hypothetical protein